MVGPGQSEMVAAGGKAISRPRFPLPSDLIRPAEHRFLMDAAEWSALSKHGQKTMHAIRALQHKDTPLYAKLVRHHIPHQNGVLIIPPP